MLLGGFILVLLVGILLSLSMFVQEEGAGNFRMRGILILMVTGVISFCLLVLMTAKFWFPHLWKKNSTHDRHKQHSQYHPASRDQEYRKRHNRR